MYGLSLGIQQVNEILPKPVYALLSGLNASTVGIVALAAVKLAEGAIKDNLTRILVITGACAGLCYNALWYFPAIITLSGVVTVVWDMWLEARIRKLRLYVRRRRDTTQMAAEAGEHIDLETIVPREEEVDGESSGAVHRRAGPVQSAEHSKAPSIVSQVEPLQPGIGIGANHAISLRVGISVLLLFVGTYHGSLALCFI